MRDLISALQKAIDTENWYAALFVALAIPDICSSLESPVERPSVRYPRWFDNHKGGEYRSHLTGKDCYALRCSYLHNGSSVTEHQRIKEVVDKFSFSPSGSHLCSFGDVKVGSCDDGKSICHLSVKVFSEDMITYAEKWLEGSGSEQEIQRRINDMLKINPVNFLYDGTIRVE